MERKALIKAWAVNHKARGIYDNSCCRTGVERIAYAEAWGMAYAAK